MPHLVATRERVQLLRWPLQADERDVLAAPACLWLLPPGELAPPVAAGEDWIRLPADERDVHARLQRLAARATAPAPLVPGEVEVRPDGRARRGASEVVLPRIEAAMLAALAERPESVVPRSALAEAAWGDAGRTGRVVDSRMFSLRGRLAPLAVVIYTIRGRGYLLTAASPTGAPAPKGKVHGGDAT